MILQMTVSSLSVPVPNKQSTGSSVHKQLNAGRKISLPFSCCLPDTWRHLSLFNLAKVTKHTCSLSAAFVTSLSASNPDLPLPATWELPSIITAFYCRPLSSSRAQESCLRSFLTNNVQTSGMSTSQRWCCQ